MAEKPFCRSRLNPRSLWALALLLSLGALPGAAQLEDFETLARPGTRATTAPVTLEDHPTPYLVRDLAPETESLGPSGLRSFGDRVLGYTFELLDTSASVSLDWLFRSDVTVSDGTEAGTLPLLPQDVTFAWWMSEIGSDRLQYFAACEAPVRIAAGCTSRRTDLWRTDGTPEGTFPLTENGGLDAGSGSLFDGLYLDHRDLMFFRGAEEAGEGERSFELWVSDGTRAGTRLLADLDPEGSGFPGHMVELDSHLYFTFGVGSGEASRRFVGRSDGTAEGTRRLSDFEADDPFGQPFYARSGNRPPAAVAGGRLFFGARDPDHGWELWAVELPDEGTAIPQRPAGDPLSTPAVPGFAFWVRITPGTGEGLLGRAEAACIPETLCVSGAIPGRSEVFARIVGPKPNGFLWPTVVKFTTSTVEVWVEQLSTGQVRYYRLKGASPGSGELPGLFDREGFLP